MGDGHVSVPLFGDSFFIERKRLINAAALMLFPSPYSGILFLSFVCGLTVTRIAGVLVSVPLFGDSFFMKLKDVEVEGADALFPSPYSGILFLFQLVEEVEMQIGYNSFRPLIRGFFFYSTHRWPFS